MSDENRAIWREVEPRLLALGTTLEPNLTEDQRQWYAEWLAANELGLALEMLADWLCEGEIPVRAVDRTEMLALAHLMGIEERIARQLAQCPPDL
jgi:hypothetical protein